MVCEICKRETKPDGICEFCMETATELGIVLLKRAKPTEWKDMETKNTEKLINDLQGEVTRHGMFCLDMDRKIGALELIVAFQGDIEKTPIGLADKIDAIENVLIDLALITPDGLHDIHGIEIQNALKKHKVIA